MIFHKPKRREIEVEKVTKFHEHFVCSTCGKVFLDAIKVRDLLDRSGETYYACPRCLTKVNVQSNPPKTSVSTALVEPSTPKPSLECPHYKNLKKGFIPDECLVCLKLIECTKRVN